MVKSENLPLHELGNIPLFKGVSDTDLQTILEDAHRVKKSEGEFFFLQGYPAERMFVLIHGRVRLFQTSSEGDQVLIKIIIPYTLFALVAMTQTQNYPVSAQAAEDSESLYWNKVDLMEYVIKYPVVAINAMKMMAEQVTELQERFRQTATEPVDHRLAQLGGLDGRCRPVEN